MDQRKEEKGGRGRGRGREGLKECGLLEGGGLEGGREGKVFVAFSTTSFGHILLNVIEDGWNDKLIINQFLID